jgi:predicted Zn-dependent peptidase
MTGSMMREGGTASMSPSEFDEELDFLAANAGVFVGNTSAGASLNTLKGNFDEAFAMFMEMVREPGFDAERLRLNKDERLEQMKQRNDRAPSIARRAWNDIMFGEGHFESRQATAAMVESITEDDLRAMHQTIFNPANLIIGVSGDFDEDEMLATLEAATSGWAFGERVGDPPAPNHDLKPGVYHVEKNIPQGRVQIGHRGVKRDDPDAIAIDIMNDILGGGGFTSRITKKVRSDEGLAYGAGSQFSDRVWYPGTFGAGFQSKSATVALGIQLILDEMERMRTEPVSEKELETSQNSFIETFPRRFESKGAMIGTFIEDEMTDRPEGFWQTYRDRVRAVTADDIQRVAEDYLHPSRAAILVVGKWKDIYKGDIDGRASMADFYGGQVEHMPLRDPMTLEPLPVEIEE